MPVDFSLYSHILLTRIRFWIAVVLVAMKVASERQAEMVPVIEEKLGKSSIQDGILFNKRVI